MLPPFTIKFQAFIPKSLGKTLLSYLEKTNRFKLLNNKEEFVQKIQNIDSKGYTWLPEPGSSSNYYATDDVEMFNHHSDHSIRLGLEAEINLNKIGNYRFKHEIFKHKNHGSSWGGVNSQHSDESHQVEVYIKRIPFYTDMPRASDKDLYIGVCGDIVSDRSDEDPLDITIKNLKKHSFSKGGNDTTKVKVSASAGYPFAEPISPNIDFELDIELYKNLTTKSIDISIEGWHNYFPAYELIIGEKVIYTHDPSDYGYTEPGFANLITSKEFKVLHKVSLSDYQVRNFRDKK